MTVGRMKTMRLVRLVALPSDANDDYFTAVGEDIRCDLAFVEDKIRRRCRNGTVDAGDLLVDLQTDGIV